ncbi:MAG: hypothetical protein DIU69_06690 [Bacillota bacterium]|nr:MAG: hypothetical protein DIU69_06690 [Bacillota bacterium]
MGPRHLAQCYRCRRTFEADRRGARYCPDCEREQRKRFRVLPGGRHERAGRVVLHPRAEGSRRFRRWPAPLRSSRLARGWWHSNWRWRRWHQPLRLTAVVAAAAAARTVWEALGGGSAPVEWPIYLLGGYWIWSRRGES